MAKTQMTVTFSNIGIASHTLGGKNEGLSATIQVSIVVNGKTYRTACQIKQVTGSAYGDEGNIEVSAPLAYFGPPVDYTAFRDGAERYYRQHVGKDGRVIRGDNMTLENVSIKYPPMTIEMETEERGGGW